MKNLVRDEHLIRFNTNNMHTAVFIFQLLSLTKMLTICCSGDVYVSTEKRTWAASHQNNNCNLATSSGNITISHTVPHATTIVWVDKTNCSTRKVWINMTGCFNLTITPNGSIQIPVDGIEDPVVFCRKECKSNKVFLTSTECYCSEFVRETSGFRCQGSSCGKHNNRLCGFNGNTLNTDNKCVCGYERTNISTNESGNCMSTKNSGNIFVNVVQNCSQHLLVMCTNNQNKHSALLNTKTDWTEALTLCKQDGNFIGVNNGSHADLNINATFWVGLFSVELTKLTCMALNITNLGHQLIRQNCSQQLPSLCINKTANTSSNQTMELTSTPVATSLITTHSSVTRYPSTSTSVSQTHSLPKEQAITSSSTTSSPSPDDVVTSLIQTHSSVTRYPSTSTINSQTHSLPKKQAITSSSTTSSPSPDDVVTQAMTKCENPSSGSADHSTSTTTTTTTTTLSTGTDPPKENANRKSSSEFPTLAVGFGAGGAVALILVLLMVVVFYRRRKQHRSNNSKKDVPKLYDGNPRNTQQITSKTMMKDNNDHTKENRIISNVLSDDVEESARTRDYDHLDTHKNRKLTHNHGRPAEAFYNSTYYHVGHQLVNSQTDQDGSAYNNFSQKNESVLFSGVEYDHIVRNTDMYDHMGTGSFTKAEDSDYDHTGSGERVLSGTGRHGTCIIAPINGSRFDDHPLSEGNYDNKEGNDQWHTLNSDRFRNGHDKHHTEPQYDHLPNARVKRDISHSREGDYDHTFAVDEYDHIGSENKRYMRSVVQEDEYDHVTEL